MHLARLFPLFSGLLALTLGVRAATPARPNVLFFFCDDQRADTIAALGNSHIKTPHLDRLVRRGIAFNRAYMMGGLQGATCVPSRAMLLSGRSLFRADEKLLAHDTWPAAFGRAGYTTFLSGKWHNGQPSIAKSFQRGRSMLVAGMADPMNADLSHLQPDGSITPPKRSPEHICAVFADEAIALINEKSTSPFFCYIPFDGPHDPHVVPPDFPVTYDPATMPLPPNFRAQHEWDNGHMQNRDETLLPWPRTPEAIRTMNAEYYRYITYLDAQIGRVLDALDASPHAQNTYIVFAADSGVARGSHGLIGKQNLYEHSMRVPLLIAGPSIPANRTTDAMCYLFDVLPTLGALCGVKGPATSEGLDLTPTLRDPSQPARERLLFAFRHVQRGLRDDRWKLIRYPEIDRTQLFDLQEDPHEITNLASRPQHAARVKAMMSTLESERRRWDDNLPSLTAATIQRAEFVPLSPAALEAQAASKKGKKKKA